MLKTGDQPLEESPRPCKKIKDAVCFLTGLIVMNSSAREEAMATVGCRADFTVALDSLDEGNSCFLIVLLDHVVTLEFF